MAHRMLLLAVLVAAGCASSGRKDEAQVPAPAMKSAAEVEPLDWPFEAPDVPDLPEGESLDDESFWDSFIDDEDGQFDMGQWLETPAGFFPLAVPITEPAVGYGLGVGLLFFHPKDKAPPAEGEKREPPSISAAFGGATSNGSWFAGGGHLGIWNDDHIRYTGGLAAFNVNLKFYGIGEGSVFEDRPARFTLGGWALLQGIKFRIPDSQFFLGVNYTWVSFDNTFEFNFDKINLPPIESSARQSGISPLAQFDSRDNIFTPNTGVFAALKYDWFNEAIGGDDSFDRVTLDSHGYLPLFDGLDLGARFQYGWASDKTPFYLLPFVQMRGIPVMRYLGNYMASIEVEPRIALTDRWAIVVFGGVGRVGLTPEDFRENGNIYAVGTGFRYLIAKKMGIYAGCDIAFSDDTTAFYITFGSAWMGI